MLYLIHNSPLICICCHWCSPRLQHHLLFTNSATCPNFYHCTWQSSILMVLTFHHMLKFQNIYILVPSVTLAVNDSARLRAYYDLLLYYLNDWNFRSLYPWYSRGPPPTPILFWDSCDNDSMSLRIRSSRGPGRWLRESTKVPVFPPITIILL